MNKTGKEMDYPLLKKKKNFDPSMFNLNEPIYMNTPDYEAKLKAKQNKENK